MSALLTQPNAKESIPKSEWFYATKPARWTLFWRTFLPWQAWRFVWINAKMIKIIGRGHSFRMKRVSSPVMSRLR